MFRRFLPLLMAGFALWQWDSRRRQRRYADRRARPVDVTTWEGEGGALPESGSHLGPEPARP